MVNSKLSVMIKTTHISGKEVDYYIYNTKLQTLSKFNMPHEARSNIERNIRCRDAKSGMVIIKELYLIVHWNIKGYCY